MATTSAAILSLPTPSLLARQGLRASPRGLRWNNIERNCLKKDGTAQITAKFELKPPPYALDALEPHMSRETLEYHWGKHHRTYVENLNKQIEGTDLEAMTLEDIIVSAYNKGNAHSAFNNAAQAWNHEFFWESMRPGGGGKPSGELLRLIKRDFGSFEGFVKEFRTAATSQPGSGWAWLTYKGNTLDVGNAKNPCPSDEDKKLVVVKSPNAINPLIWNHIPLLTIDVWEHAYYLDFENGRPDYISIFLEKLVSWETVSSRLEEAKAKVDAREREQELREKEEEDKLFPEVEMVLPSDEDESELSETETENETNAE